MKSNDLVDFMHTVTRTMGDEYSRIQKRSTEDQGTAGDQGEENWASLFKDWLPADYQVVTKGRLLSEKGVASPQIDVIVLYPFYPKHLLDKKLYLTAGVAAAFECKNTLRAKDIQKSVKNAAEIRNLLNIKSGTYRDEMYSPIVYGLIAHSHSWKSENSTPIENIQKQLVQADLEYAKHPRESLDFICVSDLAVWATYKQPMSTQFFSQDSKPYVRWVPGPRTGYGLSDKSKLEKGSEPNKNLTPIGAFLSKLINKLALNDERLKDFSLYFARAVGGGVEIKWRQWPIDVLSEQAQKDLSINQQVYQKEWLREG
ncbi:TPA: hypothetical protein NGU10_001516 [Vibrio parahaemolyticus]|nr:hypothetical protein [Vibrio parahaemolyticus]HCE2486536.1 hypothetical protein [Vibrio parahaemolyticus]